MSDHGRQRSRFVFPRVGFRVQCLLDLPQGFQFQMATIEAHRNRLLQCIEKLESCAVAFSAGVDSTVVAKAAQVALGQRAVAVTGVSASLASGELAEASALAKQIGIRHEIIRTGEFENTAYTENSPRRCFHCKSELYTQMHQKLGDWEVATIVNGANLDDQGDYRPGLEAASQLNVRSPLAECEIGKGVVRELAEYWKLPIWNKPATPCLSSRVAYGEEVTAERLAMIDRAETFLRDSGFGTLRVRYHAGDLARIEVPSDRIEQLADSAEREQLVAEFQKIGFRYICLDLEGFRSGSQNLVLASVWKQ